MILCYCMRRKKNEINIIYKSNTQFYPLIRCFNKFILKHLSCNKLIFLIRKKCKSLSFKKNIVLVSVIPTSLKKGTSVSVSVNVGLRHDTCDYVKFFFFKFNLPVSTCLCRYRVRCLAFIGLSYTLSYEKIWITNEITQIPSFNITNIHTQVLELELNKHHKKLLSMLQLTHQCNTSCKYHSKFKYPVYYL